MGIPDSTLAGVQHVADCVSIAWYTSGTAPVALPNTAYLFDGRVLILSRSPDCLSLLPQQPHLF
jgi:hypothetical protein